MWQQFAQPEFASSIDDNQRVSICEFRKNLAAGAAWHEHFRMGRGIVVGHIRATYGDRFETPMSRENGRESRRSLRTGRQPVRSVLDVRPCENLPTGQDRRTDMKFRIWAIGIIRGVTRCCA